ncbi:hypothetical protein HDU92_004181 [Lobulomyces angularis]|nr:hypothetical protein HDU92_004181 [Lobulomyces angularis]
MSLLFNESGNSTLTLPKHTVEYFLDYACPYSAKLFATFLSFQRSNFVKDKNVNFIFRHQVQLTYTSKVALAVQKVDPTKFFHFSELLFKQQENFFDVNVWDKTRTEIYNELLVIVESIGVDKSKVSEYLKLSRDGKNAGNGVTNDLKKTIKYSRQNSIHVSPTVVFNGLIDNNTSSSWSQDGDINQK